VLGCGGRSGIWGKSHTGGASMVDSTVAVVRPRGAALSMHLGKCIV